MISRFEFGVSPFYFFRHGEPHESNSGILQCQVESELSRVGRQWAEAAARQLANAGLKSIYCSPLTRALASAVIIADLLQIPIYHLPDLRDRRSGLHRPAAEPGGMGFQIPENLEPIEAFSLRVIDAMRSITGPQPILVVAHSGVFRVISNFARHPRTRLTVVASKQLFHLQPASIADGRWRVTEMPT